MDKAVKGWVNFARPNEGADKKLDQIYDLKAHLCTRRKRSGAFADLGRTLLVGTLFGGAQLFKDVAGAGNARVGVDLLDHGGVVRDTDHEFVGAFFALFALKAHALTNVGPIRDEDLVGRLFVDDGTRLEVHADAVVPEALRISFEQFENLVVDLRVEKRLDAIRDELDVAGRDVADQFGQRKAPGFDVGHRGVARVTCASSVRVHG